MPAKKTSTARRGPSPESAEEDLWARAAGKSPRANEGASDEIGRAQILRKYWELANLDPEITKGTITGQLKALDSLCGELGMAPGAQGTETPGPDKAAGAPAIYRSAWIRTASKTQDDE